MTDPAEAIQFRIDGPALEYDLLFEKNEISVSVPHLSVKLDITFLCSLFGNEVRLYICDIFIYTKS